MPRDKACRNCKTITPGKICPKCQSTDLTFDWSGLVVILTPEKSQVAEAAGTKTPGRYAVKVS